jgi:hypothetical protein
MQNWLFGLSGYFFLWRTPFDIKENDEHAPDIALHLSRLFRSAQNQTCHSNTRVWLMLSPPNACLATVRVSVPLFPRFAQNLMHTRCRIHREIAPQNQHIHPAAWNFVHSLAGYASSVIYRCIALLQLLYRWQHQSWKLWIQFRHQMFVVGQPWCRLTSGSLYFTSIGVFVCQASMHECKSILLPNCVIQSNLRNNSDI